MGGKQPRFFCEFCGTEVKRKDKVCPKCGKFFSAVRCPSCGTTGQAALFIKGCPSCGYAVLPNTATGKNPATKKKKKKPHLRHATNKRKPQDAGDPLPLWVYVAVAALLAIVVAGVVMRSS